MLAARCVQQHPWRVCAGDFPVASPCSSAGNEGQECPANPQTGMSALHTIQGRKAAQEVRGNLSPGERNGAGVISDFMVIPDESYFTPCHPLKIVEELLLFGRCYRWWQRRHNQGVSRGTSGIRWRKFRGWKEAMDGIVLTFIYFALDFNEGGSLIRRQCTLILLLVGIAGARWNRLQRLHR